MQTKLLAEATDCVLNIRVTDSEQEISEYDSAARHDSVIQVVVEIAITAAFIVHNICLLLH
jgi:hypothetical protein